MPRIIVADTLGPPENYRIAKRDAMIPGAGQVRINVRAAGLSFVDTLTASGGYQIKPPTPFVPGTECAGVIDLVGPGVTGFRVGQRVLATAWGNMLAEQAVVPAKAVIAIPEALSFEEAAVFQVSYATAWHALVQRAHLRKGESMLVLGAGGATGYAAIQIGKHLGARVIGSASSTAKRDLAAAAGADAVVESGSKTWREDVKNANGDRPVDVVFDPVGGHATEPAFRLLSWKGRHLVIGFAGGIATLRTNLPLLRGASLVGVDLRQFASLEPKLAAENASVIMALAAEGALRPAIGKRYPFEDFALAMHDAASGKTAGRIVLMVNHRSRHQSEGEPRALPVVDANNGAGHAF